MVKKLVSSVALKNKVLVGFELTYFFRSVEGVDGCGRLDALVDVSTRALVHLSIGMIPLDFPFVPRM